MGKKSEDGPKNKSKKKYCEEGYFVKPRKILGSELCRHRSAWILFDHLVGWANWKDTPAFRKGELPIGEDNMAERLGWSVLTVRKALRVLIQFELITTTADRRTPRTKQGTIITVVDYTTLQDVDTYKKGRERRLPLFGSVSDPIKENFGSVSDPKGRHIGSVSDPIRKKIGSVSDPKQVEFGSETDPTVFSSSSPQASLSQPPQLLTGAELFSSYFDALPHSKESTERKHFAQLSSKFAMSEIFWALEYVRNNPVRVGKDLIEIPSYPMAYLAKNIDQVLKRRPPERDERCPDGQIREEEVETLAHMEKTLQEFEASNNQFTEKYRSRVEQKRQSLQGTVGRGEICKDGAEAQL